MFKRVRNFWISGIAAAFLAGPALAQEETPGSSSIIVTGERLSRAVDETASSVSVTTDEQIGRHPDTDRLDRILEVTPNVTIGSGGLGPTIRGQDTTGVLRDLPAFLGGNRPRTTLIIDGRPSSYYEFVFGAQALWDVERVEVFRSPQTTTQGRNSISGAIFVETKVPEFDWNTSLRAIVADRDTSQFSGMLTGPLLKNQAAFRVAVDRRREDPVSRLSGGDQAVDPNRDFYDMVRAKLLLTPTFISPLTVETTYSHVLSQAPQVAGIREPFRVRSDTRARYGVFRNKIDSLTVRPRWEIGTNISMDIIASFGWAEIERFAPPGLGETRIDQKDRTLEAVVRYDRSEAGFVAGLSHGRISLSQFIDVTTVGIGIGNFADRQTSFGLFGEFWVKPVVSLSLTIGGRYQSDRQRRTGALVAGNDSKPLDYDGKTSRFLPKFSVAYDLASETTVGVLIQRAANPGGTTLLADTGGMDIFAPETLWDFELFLRGKSASGDLRYEANFFYYDMDNAQRSVTRSIETPGGSFSLVEIGNATKAWSKGAELRVAWQALSKLEFVASIGLLDTKIVTTPDPDDPLIGKQFQRSPHFTGALGAYWRPLPAISLSLSYFRRSGYFDDDLNTSSRRIGGADHISTRAEWSPGNWKVFAFARNLFNHFYLTSLDASGLATAGDPRELGAGLEVMF